MVGRIFFPPSSSKKYLAAAFSTGCSVPINDFIPSLSPASSPATSSKGSGPVASGFAILLPEGLCGMVVVRHGMVRYGTVRCGRVRQAAVPDLTWLVSLCRAKAKDIVLFTTYLHVVL